MSKETQRAVGILQQWSDFTDAHPDGNTKDFARWLLDTSQASATSAVTPDESAPDLPDDYMGALIGRIARFTILWSKKMFEDSPLRTMEEFGVLMIVQRFPDARKSDIVYHSLLEPTTCFEILKRLQKMGYLADRPDETDRRSRLVHITEAGKQVCQSLYRKLSQLSQLTIGNISGDERRIFAQILQQLEDFHEGVYANHRAAPLDEIMAAYFQESE